MKHSVPFAQALCVPLIACALAAATAISPVCAWALDDALAAGELSALSRFEAQAEAEEGVVTAGEWQLGYRIQDGDATITGVQVAPASTVDLAIPAEAGGAPVTAIGDSAFEGQSALGAVSFPDTLVTIGSNAFRESSITAVEFPASLAYVPYQCFWNCTKLATVTFAEGCHPEYLGTRAFMKCSALTEIAVPALVGSSYDWICENPTGSFSGKGQWRVGFQCFVYCTSLQKLSFLPGNPTGITEYLKAGGQQYGHNASNFVILNYCKGSISRYASTATCYFAINFYQSEADAQADVANERPWKRAFYRSDTNIFQVLKKTSKAVAYEGSDEIPDMPEQAAARGLVWGVANGAMSSTRSTLLSTIDVYPVDPRDLSYGWVSSPEIEADASSTGLNIVNNDNAAYVRLPQEGPADVSHIAAYAPDGTKLDPADYVLCYESGKQVPRANSSFFDTEWTEIESPDLILEEGSYRVRAKGVGDFADTETAGVSFGVRHYRPVVNDFTSTSPNEGAGLAVERAVKLLGSKPKFMVVASADSWQNCLVASGLAGAGGGVAMLSAADATSAAGYRAMQASDATDVIFLGSDSVGASVIAKVKTNMGSGTRYDVIEGASPEQMSLAVYQTVKKYGPAQADPYQWGSTAIVASAARSFGMMPIAQYAYQAKAPVFFADADGALSDEVLAAIAEGGFDTVVVAGDATCVSDAAFAQISSVQGVSAKRVLDQGSNGYDKSARFVDVVRGDFVGDDGAPLNRATGAIVAQSGDPATVVAAAQLAAVSGYTLLATASSLDVKQAQDRMVEVGGDLTDVIYAVGDFEGVCGDVASRMVQVWSLTPSGAPVAGDTAELGGLTFTLKAQGKATLTGSAEPYVNNVVAERVSFGSASYEVDAIAPGAFAGSSQLQTLSTTARAIGAGAFERCENLASANLPSAASIEMGAFRDCSSLASLFAPATSVGDEAFLRCSSLASAQLPSAASIGANAFSGCAALKSASIPAATSIGASAFEGCASLGSITTKASSIGASAFAGCSSLSKATLSAAKLKALPDSIFSGCRALSGIKLSSTALKSIGANAFKSCSKLKSLDVKSKKLATVGASAFSGCTKLAKASFASTALKSVGKQAFMNCKKLKTLTIKSKKIKTVGANAFKKAFAKMQVKVPKAKIKAYKKLFKKAGLTSKAKFSKA